MNRFKNETSRDANTGLKISGPCLMNQTRSWVERAPRLVAGVSWVASRGEWSVWLQYDRQRSKPMERPVWGETISWQSNVAGVGSINDGGVDAAVERCGEALAAYGLKEKQVERAERALRREARLARFYIAQREDPSKFNNVAAKRDALRDIAAEARALLEEHDACDEEDDSIEEIA